MAVSLSVYAIPILSAHWASLLGITLVREMGSDREPAWKAADVLMALGLQGVQFAIAWVLAARGRGLAVVAAAAAWLPLAFVANALYMAAIPARFLIERDDAADANSWTEVCSLPGYSLDPVRAGVRRGLERRGAAWVRSDGAGRYGIMKMPGCQVEAVAIPESPMMGLFQALTDGGAVYSTVEPKSGVPRYWLLPARGSQGPIFLDPPEDASQYERIPLVSEDGLWVARIERDKDRRASIRIRKVAEGADGFVFTHELLQRATLTLVELDMAERRIVINREMRTFAALGLDGSVAWGPIEAPVAAQQDTFRYLGANDWLAWDAYVEKQAYRLAWPSGTYAIPRGSVITSAALSADGRLAAVSSSTGLNIGSVPDKILALRTADRAVVFRKTLPRYTRAQVAFLGNEYFAYSDFDGTRSAVRVLRPEAR